MICFFRQADAPLGGYQHTLPLAGRVGAQVKRLRPVPKLSHAGKSDLCSSFMHLVSLSTTYSSEAKIRKD